ncbi:MAG: diphosphomevalonate decarboxylase [Flavobacterium sp.]|nr:diphosphomevalonate decarboxylase [Flavobacterium sp.]
MNNAKTESDFLFNGSSATLNSGAFTWSAPSNIALVKYWGKHGQQLPANPSISFTLNNCKTITSVAFESRSQDKFSFDLFFEGSPKEDFKPKIQKFLDNASPYIPFINQLHLTIDTQNTFPHSSGIASSASGMAALAMNLMSIEKLLNPEMADEYFFQKASFLARIGSGSACRSIDGKMVVWGKHQGISESSDLYGVTFDGKVHEIFENFQDTILLVDKGEKQVSSSLGHGLMNGHPFAEQRFSQAHANLSELKSVFESGDLQKFIEIVESEALTLHSMMMTSKPYFILMKPNTLEIINKIWNFRNKTGVPICFTLDAGANVHVLYPESHKEKALEFIKAELVAYCQSNQYICDEVGTGAKQLASNS